MNRYFDYCSEALALISKIAALYVQRFQDTVLLNAVDAGEDFDGGVVAENLAENYHSRNPGPDAPHPGTRRQVGDEFTARFALSARAFVGEDVSGLAG